MNSIFHTSNLRFYIPRGIKHHRATKAALFYDHRVTKRLFFGAQERKVPFSDVNTSFILDYRK